MSSEILLPPQDVKELNPLSSLRMLREDICLFGSIRPEKWRAVFEEDLTLHAEAMGLPISTAFTYEFVGNDLIAEGGRSHSLMLEQGERTARSLVGQDSRHQFGWERAVADKAEGQVAIEFMRTAEVGDTLVTASPMALEALAKHGRAFMNSKGYQSDRLMGFFYTWHKKNERDLVCGIQSVDNTDLDAFAHVFKQFGQVVPTGLDSLGFRYIRAHVKRQVERDEVRRAYDQYMTQKHGGEFYAGRRKLDRREAMEFIVAQQDLIVWYQQAMQELATLPSKGDAADEAAVKQIIVTFAASLKWRLEGKQQRCELNRLGYLPQEFYQQLQTSYQWAQKNHFTVVACGGLIGVNPLIEQTSVQEALGVLWSSDKIALHWRKGTCRNAELPSHPKDQLAKEVGDCNICRHCQGLYDEGVQPDRIYTMITSVSIVRRLAEMIDYLRERRTAKHKKR